MTEKRKSPALRFRGYTDDWEQRKLGEYVSITSGEAPSKFEEGTELYVKVDDLNYNDKYVVDTQNKVAEHSTVKRVTKGSVVFPKRGAAIMTNKVRIMGIDSYMDTNMMALTSEKLDSEFLYNIISKEGLYKIADTSTIPQINNKHVEPYDVTIPSLAEQRRIGAYFKQLDHLITLHQRKLEKLKLVKKSMLEKMFPKNGSSVPEIRFKGFTDDWEQRKLGEVVERIVRKNENLESTLPLTISAQYGLIDQNEFFDKRIASKDVSGYYLVRKGEFAYNKSTSSDAPWGAVKRLDRYESGVLSTLYIVFEIIDETETCSDYLVTYYSTDLWHKGIQAIAAEGARNHGLLNIAPVDFFETELMLPSNIVEQRKIGAYFKQLNNLITLHQRKLKKLQVSENRCFRRCLFDIII